MGQITPLDKKEVSQQMNKRREHILAAVTAIFLAMCLCLLGCGGSGGNNSPQMSSAQAAPSAEPAAPAPEESYDYDYGKDTSQIVSNGSDGEAGGAPQFDLPDTRKVIRHANMELETKEFDPALSGILQAVANAGGYIESQDQGGGSSYGSGRYRERYANINARVPSAKLDEVIRSVGGLCNVVTQSQSMDDITDRYYDAEAHLTTLRVQEERLLEILSKAEKLEDIITLESALSDVRYQIESLTASLRRMDSQVTYSFLNLSLQEVVEYQVMQEKPRTFGERMKEAYGDGIDDLVNGLQSFAIWLARVGPSLLVWIAIILVIVLIVRSVSRANAKRRADRGLPPRGNAPSTYTTNNPQPQFQRYPQPPVQRPPMTNGQPPVQTPQGTDTAQPGGEGTEATKEK